MSHGISDRVMVVFMGAVLGCVDVVVRRTRGEETSTRFGLPPSERS